MLWQKELSEEDKNKLIEKIAKKIVEKRLEVPAIFFLESIKPVAFVGTQISYIVFAPFLYLLGPESFNYLSIFEKREDIEKLLSKIEELSEENKEKDNVT
jgi:hypothetical protein